VATLVPQGAFPAQADAVVRDGAPPRVSPARPGRCSKPLRRGGRPARLALPASAMGCGGPPLGAGKGRRGADREIPDLGRNRAGHRFHRCGLSAEEAVAVLFGALLRGWRLDVYRTKLTDEQKPSLAEIVAIGAPDGEAAWQAEAALAEGVEFTRELVTEPANVIYPESFVARAQAGWPASAWKSACSTRRK
jgi:leucyl aminopeptidase